MLFLRQHLLCLQFLERVLLLRLLSSGSSAGHLPVVDGQHHVVLVRKEGERAGRGRGLGQVLGVVVNVVWNLSNLD